MKGKGEKKKQESAKKDRVQTLVRMYPDVLDELKAKVVQDKLTIQKLSEILFRAYLKDNKEIRKLIQKHADEKYARKRRWSMDEEEADELLRSIEKNHSPLKDSISTIYNEIQEEDLFDED